MEISVSLLWNLILTVGGAVGMFMLNRVANTLDGLQKEDKALGEKISDLKNEFVSRPEFLTYSDRLEKRLEAYHALQMESNKTLFAKLDLLVERMGEKISRQECLQMLNDRRGAPRDIP